MRLIRIAEIVAVGSELLTPHRIDTNSLWLTARLNEAGVDVRGKVVVGDDRDELALRLRQALARADIVITTGGLGPTGDDLTREAVADVLGRPLVEDERVLDGLRGHFARRGIPMPEITRRQAQVPRGATVLENANGTAPGLILDAPGERLVLCLPGPARELQPMVEHGVLPRLALRTARRVRRGRVVKITGRTESQIEEVVSPLDAALARGVIPVERTILATPGQIEIHVSAVGEDAGRLDEALDAAAAEIARRVGAPVFSTDGRSLEAVVGELLRDRGWRLAAAESCTGGLLLGRLTDVPGSSAWIVGGVIAYANDVKVAELDVPADVIAGHGAVSEPVAAAMARGVRRRLGAHVGVAITGIAGPSGGSPEKPVGTVVIAADGHRERVCTFTFPGDRAMVRALSVAAALDLVRRELMTTA
jgi:nicotinamide-nucleotide amidase